MDNSVCACVLNWNRFEDTRECVESILNSTYKNIKIIIVDNNSAGNDVAKLQEVFGNTIMVIPSKKNLGYSEAVNCVSKIANTDFLFVVENDSIIDSVCIAELVKLMQNDKNIGIAAPIIYSYYDRNKVQYSGRNIDLWKDMIFPSILVGKHKLGVGNTKRVVSVNHISFWCALIRQSVFEEVGGINEEYFWGWEEVELCFNVISKGWKIMVSPKAKMYHKARSSQGKNPMLQYYSTRNKFLVMYNNTSKLEYCLFVTYILLIHIPLATIFYLVIRQSWSEFVSAMLGIHDGMTRRFGIR